jgi:hypothetical protein
MFGGFHQQARLDFLIPVGITGMSCSVQLELLLLILWRVNAV